jgi:hypothetical protein
MELLWVFTQALGFGGAFLIANTVLAAYKPNFRSPGLEAIAPFLSSLATILGTLVLAGAVYLPVDIARPAWPHTRIYVAPAVMAGCIVALYVLISSGNLATPVVTGFGLLAISGSLKRLIPGDVPKPPDNSK